MLKFGTSALILFLMISSIKAHGTPSAATAQALPNQTAASKAGWEAPPAGCIKMNVVGRNWSADNSTSSGGVFRGSDGLWIFGFTIKLGKGNILEAELWGLYHGLRLAWDKGFPRIEAETVSATAIHLIKQTEHKGHPLATLLSDLKDLMFKRDWKVEISLINKQQNLVANRLAEIADGNKDLDLIVYDNPPYTIDHLLNVDRIGT